MVCSENRYCLPCAYSSNVMFIPDDIHTISFPCLATRQCGRVALTSVQGSQQRGIFIRGSDTALIIFPLTCPLVNTRGDKTVRAAGLQSIVATPLTGA